MKEYCQDAACCMQCGDKLIHQGARRAHESGSPFGQWVHDNLPRDFTVGDVDLYVRRWYRADGKEVVLLRWMEHKRPGQKFAEPQQRALIDFNAIIRHAVECPSSPVALDGGSGGGGKPAESQSGPRSPPGAGAGTRTRKKEPHLPPISREVGLSQCA